VLRHHLETIGEIPVIPIRASRDAGGHLGVELGGLDAPLLARISPEKRVVEMAADLAHHRVFGGEDALSRLGDALEIGGQFVRCQVQTEEGIDGVQIDRDRNEAPFDTGQHAMLIGSPLGELREILEDLGRIGMEDVRAILMDENSGVIKPIKGITGNMRPPVDQQDARTVFAGQALGQHAAGESRANDQEVEHRRLRP